MAASNVRKNLTDAGYIVIGLGVMGFQQAQIQGRKLKASAVQAGECVQNRTRDAQSKLQEQSKSAKDLAEAQVRTRIDSTVTKAQELRGELEKRVEPAVGKVQAQLGELPEKVVQAMEPVAARVRELAGSSAA
jgi:polyhydroxyalkanoate synthesis regulator phasin